MSGGNLSEGELVRGEIVQNGTCPQGHLSGGNLSASRNKGRVSLLERLGPIDRIPVIPGSDKNHGKFFRATEWLIFF